MSKEWTTGELQYGQRYDDEEDDIAASVSAKLSVQGRQQDNLAIAQNGGLSSSVGEDADLADGEGDDSMDDDMMDKISSSPSIDDGGYYLPLIWPKRHDSLSQSPQPTSFPQAWHDSIASDDSVISNCPPPANFDTIVGHCSQKHHHTGEYPDSTQDMQFDPQGLGNISERNGHNLSIRHQDQVNRHVQDYVDDYDADYDFEAGDTRVLDLRESPEDRLSPDPFLDTAIQEDIVREGTPLMLPYDSSEDSDDDYDIPYCVETRFVDSGWGGECLQESEDIDFEFVYALHTFVATVEGQANATKGDTMVLLDDSNSYWWLVRVVKDSIIGKTMKSIVAGKDLYVR